MLNQIVQEQDRNSCNVELHELEDAVYPTEFLNAFKDTAFQAMQDFLKKSNAAKEALALLVDLAVLTIWANEVEKGGQVKPYVNQLLLETVASASRNIAAIGGNFYSPNGTTVRRELEEI